MEVISIERSTYEELLTSFNSFVTQMRAIVQEHYRLYGITGRWPILKSIERYTISLRMWRVFFMLWLVEIRISRCVTSKRSAYERTDNAS